MVPVGDPAHPSKVFVIEVAETFQPAEGAAAGDCGVLIYSVDATLASGQNPIVVCPRATIEQAAYHAGDSFDLPAAPFKLKVLHHSDGNRYTLDIQIKD